MRVMSIIHRFPLLLIIILGLVLRLWGLGLNPVGISHDEVHDLINAKSLATIGENAPGTAPGVFVTEAYCDGNCIFGELVSYLLIPWMRIVPFDLMWSKIPFIIASLGIILMAGKLFENLTGNRRIGLLTSFIVAINPWAIFFGRTALENLFTFWFFLWSLNFFTKNKAETKHLIWGFILGLLGFLSYFGAKPIFVFLIIWGIAYYWYKNKFKNKVVGSTLIALSILITITYVLILPQTSAGLRLKEVKNNQEIVADIVNQQRQVSLEIPVIRDVVINKYTVQINEITNKFLLGTSPDYLFNRGEVGFDMFMISNHAYMYLIDGILILFGIIKLGNMGAVWWFLLILLGIIQIPTLIATGQVTHALRSGLMFPIISGIIGSGWVFLEENFKRSKKIVTAILIIIYLASLVYFMLMYWYRTPMEKSKSWFFHERVLVNYIKLAKENSDKKIYVAVKDPVDVAYLYGFYTNRYNNQEFIRKFNDSLKNKIYEIDGIVLSRNCPKDYEDNLWVIENELDCKNINFDKPGIAEPKDSGQRFAIINDDVCNNTQLNRYPYPRSIKDFDVEKMNRDEFCQKWITKTE